MADTHIIRVAGQMNYVSFQISMIFCTFYARDLSVKFYWKKAFFQFCIEHQNAHNNSQF